MNVSVPPHVSCGATRQEVAASKDSPVSYTLRSPALRSITRAPDRYRLDHATLAARAPKASLARQRPERVLVWLLALLGSIVGACAPAERSGVSWRIDFACAEEASRTDRVMATIAEDDCEAPGSLLYEELITRGGTATADPGALSPGRYAFSASALDTKGSVIANACVSAILPSATPVIVTLFGSPSCTSAVVPARPDDAGAPSEVDGALGVDAGSEPDAATTCGVTDTDEDMTPDCNDGCPMDARKVDPGICGCGVSDEDSDQDGTADCDDDCPADANKTSPQQCGCGKVEGTCGLTMDDVVGAYERLPVENDWHGGRIEQTTQGVFWVNNAGVQWTLIPDLANERLLTTTDCPYYSNTEGKTFLLTLDNGRVTGFWFNSELYSSSP